MGFYRGMFLSLALAASALPALAAPRYSLVDIGTLGGPGSFATAVSDNGAVVGCSEAADGIHAFIYFDGAMQDLGHGCALAVNDSGVVAGRSGNGELVIWRGRTVTPLGVTGNVGGINEFGTVVGSFNSTGGERAFMYRDGKLTDLGSLPGEGGSAANAVNSKGEIVGRSAGHAFLYANGTMRDLGTLGGNNSAARGINERGVVVGMAANAFGQPEAFLYDGAMRALPGEGFASAISLNERIQVVASAEGRHGYLIANGEVTWLDSLPAVQAKGWRKLEPTGINERGWIVGTAVTPDGDSRAFVLVPRELSLPASSARGQRMALGS
jgi:probable HAF family extracellular repeat protein